MTQSLQNQAIIEIASLKDAASIFNLYKEVWSEFTHLLPAQMISSFTSADVKENMLKYTFFSVKISETIIGVAYADIFSEIIICSLKLL